MPIFWRIFDSPHYMDFERLPSLLWVRKTDNAHHQFQILWPHCTLCAHKIQACVQIKAGTAFKRQLRNLFDYLMMWDYYFSGACREENKMAESINREQIKRPWEECKVFFFVKIFSDTKWSRSCLTVDSGADNVRVGKGGVEWGTEDNLRPPVAKQTAHRQIQLYLFGLPFVRVVAQQLLNDLFRRFQPQP